jgi:Macrocin-O-methyltransferase (TylF)
MSNLTEADIDAIAEAVLKKMTNRQDDISGIFAHVAVSARMVASFRTGAHFIDRFKCCAGAIIAHSRSELLTAALKLAPARGLNLEFGVSSGDSLRHLAAQSRERKWFGFDSFKGIPEPWYWEPAGRYAVDSIPAMPGNVSLVHGLFSDSLPQFVERMRPELDRDGIAFLNVDCDLYSSTVDIFTHLGAWIRPGTVIHFDEYWNYIDWTNGESKAFDEFTARTGLEYKVIGYVPASVQLAVVIK